MLTLQLHCKIVVYLTDFDDDFLLLISWLIVQYKQYEYKLLKLIINYCITYCKQCLIIIIIIKY